LKNFNVSNETKVGALASIIIVILILGFNFLKGEELFSTTTNYNVRFPNAAGLQKSASVLHQGVKVGAVRQVSLAEDGNGVVVLFYLNDRIKLNKASVARLFSTDFFGTKALNIVVNDNPVRLSKNDTVNGIIDPSLLESLGATVDPLREKTESLIAGLDRTVSALDTQKIKAILAHLESTSGGISSLVNKQNSKLNTILANVESITNNLRKNNEIITAALSNINAITDSVAKSDLKSTLANAEHTLAQTDSIFTKINKGEGSIGLLVNDKALYNNLNQTAVDLDKLLADMKANPKRYVHFSLFGRKNKE